MSKFIFAICLLSLLIGLGACQSSKKADIIVSPDGYVLRSITNPDDLTMPNWIYDVNDGEYQIRNEEGCGASEILITDRQGRLRAAYGFSQCPPQQVLVTYDGDNPMTFKLMYLDFNDDEDGKNNDNKKADDDNEGIGVTFDMLMKGESLENEHINSVETYSLIYDSYGHVTEVIDSLTEMCLKAPEGHYITTKVEDTGAMSGALECNFRIKNRILPLERNGKFVEKEYEGYTLLREVRHISPVLVEDCLFEDDELAKKTTYKKEVKEHLTLYSTAVYKEGVEDEGTQTSTWENGYIVKEENISKWNTVLWRKEYTLADDSLSYFVKNYKYDYTSKILVENGEETIKVSSYPEPNLGEIWIKKNDD